MEKEIKITEVDKVIGLTSKGFSMIEILGLLRLYEQSVSIKLMEDIPEPPETKSTTHKQL